MGPEEAGACLEDRSGAGADHYTPPRHVLDKAHHVAASVQERHVEREPHPEGVDRAAAGDEESRSVVRLAKEREAEDSRPDRPRLDHPEAARKRPRGKGVKAVGEHVSGKSTGGLVRRARSCLRAGPDSRGPKLDCLSYPPT